MARSAFETLEVYRLSEDLADTIWDVAIGWSPFARDTVGKQIVRAADGIGANIAEGHGRGSDPDHKRFIRIARGSVNETKHWLRRAYRRKLLTQEQVDVIRPMIEELAPKLNAYLGAIGSGRRKPSSNKPHATSNKQ